MDYLLNFVQVFKTLKRLVGNNTEDVLRYFPRPFQDSSQTARVHELQSDVHISVLQKGPVRPQHVLTVALVQGLQFQENRLLDFGITNHWNLLHCNNLF